MAMNRGLLVSTSVGALSQEGSYNGSLLEGLAMGGRSGWPLVAIGSIGVPDGATGNRYVLQFLNRLGADAFSITPASIRDDIMRRACRSDILAFLASVSCFIQHSPSSLQASANASSTINSPESLVDASHTLDIILTLIGVIGRIYAQGLRGYR